MKREGEVPSYYAGDLSAAGQRFAIVASRFNDFITKSLIEGATDCLLRHGAKASDIETYWVPGALELALVAQEIARTAKYDAIIALGAVIRGETSHYDVVVSQSATGLAKVAMENSIPVLNGVLTTEDLDQAIARSGTKSGNKGYDVALGAIEMVNLLTEISKAD